MVLKRVREKTEGTEFIQLVKNTFLVGKKYTLKYIKEELSKLKEGKIKIYVDKYGTATTPTTRDGMRDKKRVYINSLSVDQLNNVIYGSGGISAEVTEKVKDILFKEKK